MKTVAEKRIVKQVRAINQYAKKCQLSKDIACQQWVNHGLAKQYAEGVDAKRKLCY